MPENKRYHIVYNPNDEEMRRVCNNIRKEFEAWGFDVEDMSDEEICKSMSQFAEAIRQTGVTVQQASEAIANFSRRLKELVDEKICQGSSIA